MILFGESLNVISKVIGKAYKERDPKPIQEEVQDQVVAQHEEAGEVEVGEPAGVGHPHHQHVIPVLSRDDLKEGHERVGWRDANMRE